MKSPFLFRTCLLFVFSLPCIGADKSPPAPVVVVQRCGWFDNPSPSNAWLHDRDGEWVIAIQGGHQAEGEWPRFNQSQWVRTGSGSAGYGCACLKVESDAETRDVVKIHSSQTLPLSKCRSDSAIRKDEPENPLK